MFKKLIKRIFKCNRKCKFYDLSTIDPIFREARSPILCIYSAVDNIGNYLPVLGISEMLPFKLDAWNIHDRKIDFEFINKHYKGIIIGGAGLLHGCFEHFWERTSYECKLPMIIWGVGVCLPDKEPNCAVSRDIAMRVFEKCDLVNVRDQLTVDYYGLKNADVSFCPTVVYLKKYQNKISKYRKMILFSSHEQLLSSREILIIKEKLKNIAKSFKYTNNMQTKLMGLNDIILRYYCKSRIVVSTRLHGAIIARSLGIPYIAIPRDEKIRSFCHGYSGGIMVENIDKLENVLTNYYENVPEIKPIDIGPAFRFGNKARNWIKSIT